MNRPRLLKVAGILNVVAGASFLGVYVLLLVLTTFTSGTRLGAQSGTTMLKGLFVLIPLCGVPLAGGISALQKKRWGLAMTGAAFTCLFMPFLGLPAGILTLLSRDDWSRRRRGVWVGVFSFLAGIWLLFWVVAGLAGL